MTEKIMNPMKNYSKANFIVILLAVVSLLVVFPVSEITAAETISVNAKNLDNTIIIEFSNSPNNTSEIKTIKVWLGGDKTFKSFKTEPGWGGGTYSDGKLLVFTAVDSLKSGESVKFGLITNQKVTGINWKALDKNDSAIDTNKTPIQEISQNLPNIPGSESQVTEISGDKIKFIPEKIRAASSERLVGNGFNPNEILQLFLNDNMLESVRTDQNGNFITKLNIPATTKIGINDFQIKRQDGIYESTKLKINDALNRFYSTEHRFGVTTSPETVKLEDTLNISGTAKVQSGVILSFKDGNILEKKHVVIADSAGKWTYDQTVSSNTLVGLKSLIIENEQKRVLKNITVTSDFVLQMTSLSDQYSIGDTATITGITEANKQLTFNIIDPKSVTILFDTIQADGSGKFEYTFPITSTFTSGTYAAIVKTPDNKSEATIFGIGVAPTDKIVILLDKLNFQTTADLTLRVVGPSSSSLNVQIMDSGDNIKVTETLTTNSAGNGQITLDLNGYKSGVYRAVISYANIEDIAKFSVGLQTGTGDMTLSATKSSYNPGEEIIVIGKTTNSNAILFLSLVNPNGDKISEIELFSDKNGQFTTDLLRIPIYAPPGEWTIEANSRLDTANTTIDVEI
jgi:hypothetical protein